MIYQRNDNWLFPLLALIIALLILLPANALSAWNDVTASVSLSKTRPLYNYIEKVTYFDSSLTNTSGESFQAPIRLVIDSVTTPQVTVHNADGVTDDDKPYFDFSAHLGDGTLDPGETSSAIQFEFNNPNRLRFNFTWKILVEAEAPQPENHPPTAVPGGPYSGIAGQEIMFNGSESTDPDNDPLTFEWSFGDGATATGATPTHSYAVTGTYTVTLIVTDPEGANNTAQTQAAITDINHPPSLMPIAEQTVNEGQTLTFQVIGTDPDGDDLACSANNLPEGSLFDPPTKTFSWTPTYDQAGSYAVTFTVTDTGGLSGSIDVNITVRNVNRAPLLDPVSDRSIAETKPLTFRVTGSDPDGNDLAYSAINLPADAAFDAASRTFSWTPASGFAGTYQAGFTVSDGFLTDSISVLIFVTHFDANNSPSLTPVTDQEINEGQTLTFHITGSDPNGDPLTFDVNGLPSNAAFKSTADPNVFNFSWTPDLDQAGDYTVDFTASDPGGLSDTINVDIVVHNVNRPPSLDPVSDRSIAETKPLSFQVTGSDPDGDELTYLADHLPAGALFDPDTQAFSWTPTDEQAGEYDISFSVSDGDLTDSIVVHITVIDFNVHSSPSLTPIDDQEINEGATLTFQVTASDPNDDSLIFNVNGLPAGAAFDPTADPNTYSFSWTPDFYQAGDYTVNFTVSDPEGLSDTMDVNITVNNVNRPPFLDSVSGQNVDEGTELTFQLNGSDPDQDPLDYGATNLPEGATLVPETGAFSWIPTFDQSGSYQVTFSVSDGELLAERQALIEVIDVNRAPSILTETIPNGRVDQTYRAQVVAQDPDGDSLDYSITETAAPLTIDNTTGQLSWDKPSISDLGVYSLTVRVEDARGGTDTRQYTLSVPDTIPPAIVLNAPKQGNPGKTFSAEASVWDNDAVVAVEVYGDRTDFSPPYQNTITQKKEITLPSELGTVAVHAFAWDPSGNKGEAIASVEVVATFDKTPPQVALNAPPQVAPGQVIRLTASVSDDVGVSTVTFSAEGTDIGTRTAQHPSIEYQIPAGAVIGSTIQFRATAVDFSGNSAFSEAASTVVGSGEEDTTPPDPELQTPETVTEDDPIPIAVATPNEDCLAQVDVYVNHTLAATYFAPDAGNFDVPMPDGVEGGMNVLVEAVVTDCSGNQTTTSNWIKIEEPGKGVVAGEVYNDRTGLPLADAEVTFVGEDGSTVSAITDARGQYNFVAKAGTGRLTVTKDSFTQVERTGVVVPESGGLEAFDARLTSLDDASPTVPAALGAEITIPFSVITAGFVPALEGMGIDPSSIESTDVNLNIPAGALTQNQAFTLTQICPQGLQDRLPGGWSPVGGLDISPHGIAFQAPASLAVPNPLGFDASAGIMLAAWDETEHAWRVVSSANVSADGTTISAQVPFAGQLAFILPDVSPQTPPVPVAGELLQGVSPLLIPEPVTTAIGPEPKIIFYRPGVHSDVSVSVSAGSGQLSSGAPVLVNVAEEYNFYSGDRIAPTPYMQDIVLYSLNRPALTAAFPVTPSQAFEPLALDHGVINVDVLAPTDAERGISVVAPEGGTVSLYTGETVTLPEGVTSDIVPVDLKALTVESLGIEFPAGLTFVGGVNVAFSGKEFDEPLGLFVPAPAGFDEALGQLLLVQLLEVQGATRMVLVGVGEVQGSNIVSLYTLNDNDIWFEGILSEGRYIFVQMHTGIGFATGTVFDTVGAPLDGAIVSADAMPVIAISQNDGAYVQVVNTGAFSVTALDPDKMDSGTATGTITEDGEIARLDLYLVQAPPHVVSFFPADGQENVPLETTVKVTFSEPLNPETVIPKNLTLTGPEGPVAGTLILASSNTQVTFRPTEALKADTTYTFSASQGIQDLAGYALESAFVLSFTSLDTTPPQPSPAGNITATIPDDEGRTTITTTQGMAGPHDIVSVINKTQGISTPALIEADGSFSVKIDADIMDEVVISITDSAGNETVVPVGRFENPDGSIVIGPEGGQLEADNDVILDIPAGAFPNGAVVRITGLTEAEIGIDTGPDFPFVAGFDLECSVWPETYLNASVLLPPETDADARGLVAQVVEIYDGPVLAIVDTAKAIDGRLTTSSPPCPGIAAKVGRYAMFLNEDQRMAMGEALLSMVMPVTRPYVMNPLIRRYASWFPAYADVFKGIGYALARPASLEYQGQAYKEMYKQICMPVPPDEHLKVVIRNAESGEIVDVIDIEPIAAGQHSNITYKDARDKIGPKLVAAEPVHRVIDSNNRAIHVRFSEPVSPESAETVMVVSAENNQEVYSGKWELRDNNRELIFLIDRCLPMGENYYLVLNGILDLAGNLYEGPPIRFSTFEPYLIFPSNANSLDRNKIANDLGLNNNNQIPQDLWFSDVDFITRPSYVNMAPKEKEGSKWQTDIFAIQATEGYRGDYRLFAIDAYDPKAPKVSGAFQTESGYLQHRLHMIHGAHIQPRPDAYGDPQFWKTRELHYVVDDPFVRICAVPGSPELASWKDRNCKNSDNCDVLYGGCGDLAVTTVDDTRYGYLRSYDVTNRNDQKCISARLINDNGVKYGKYRQYEAPAGVGTPLGLTAISGLDIIHGDLVNENTVGAYVANYGIGLELVDLGLNIPTINDVERRPYSIDEWAKAEALRINAQRYYTDVAIVRDKVVAIAGDISITRHTGIRTLEIFRPDLAGEPTGMVRLPNVPKRLATVTDFPIYEEDNEDPKLYDLAFITGEDGGVSIAEIPASGGNPYLVNLIPTPSGVVTKHIQINREARVAYVAALGVDEGVAGDHLLVIDVSKPFDRPTDSDNDGWDDRIIGKVPIVFPDSPFPVYLHGFRLDLKRGLIYAGVYAGGKQGLAIIKIRECSDISVDFKARRDPVPVPEDVEKVALQQVIRQGLYESEVGLGTVAMLAYGNRACLWKEGCQFKSHADKRRYRFVVLIPQYEWDRRNFILVKLYEQVIDAQGEPKTVEAMGYEVTFDDIEFLAMPLEEFERADLNLVPTPEDPGLARQTILLEWLLRGAYVEAPPELSQGTKDLAEIIALLTERTTIGENREPSHVWRVEGYELAKLQETELLKSGALIRLHGASELGTTLHQSFQEELQTVARAALRAVLARIIASEEGNLFVAFLADTYKGFGLCLELDSSSDPGLWTPVSDCKSFEHWVASVAARTVQENLGIFTIEEIVDKVYEFQKVADGSKIIGTEQEANDFIAMAYQFVTDVTTGFVWSIYQAKLMDNPRKMEREANMTALEGRIYDLKQMGSKNIRPRIVNEGTQAVKDIWIRMYESNGGTGDAIEISKEPIDIKAGATIHLPADTFVLEGVKQTDHSESGWLSFLVAIPERSVQEGNRKNNWIKLSYYVLDPANPSVPELSQGPGLPVDDPCGDLLEGDSACICQAPELNIAISADGIDSVELNAGDFVDVDVRVANVGNETLRDVRLYSTFPGLEDWMHDIPEIAAGDEVILAFQYCVPEEEKNSLEGFVWFEEMDEDYDPPPSESNPLYIDIAESLNVDAKANGKDEIFVGKGWDVTFSVTFDEANCTNPRYFWDLGDAKGLFTDPGGTYSYDEGGTYRAKVRVTCDEGWEEDVVNVHVVEVEILVNETLDDPNADADDGEMDDAVRLKAPRPENETRVFKTPCQARLKKRLAKDAWVMLMSPESRLGFAADSGNPTSTGTTPWELTLPKDGGLVNFAITGELGSDQLNDAVIMAFLEDPGTPVAEEDVTVYWYDEAKIEIEVCGVYGMHESKKILKINNKCTGDKETEPSPGYHDLTCEASPHISTSFPTYAVIMKAKATLKPDGACDIPQTAQTRIGITQNCTDIVDIVEYHDPEFEWDWAGQGAVQSTTIHDSIRITNIWPQGYLGWIFDGDVEEDKECDGHPEIKNVNSLPLYEKNFSLKDDTPTFSSPKITRPPAPCGNSTFSFTTYNGQTHTDSGIWLADTPDRSHIPDIYPKDRRIPVPAGPDDDTVVGWLKYNTRGRVIKKERFRTWVVTYWREGSYDTYGPPEEIVPLREIEWWIDLDTGAVDSNGVPDLSKHQAQADPHDTEPEHFPNITGPAAHHFKVNAPDPDLRITQEKDYFGNTNIISR